MVYNLNYITKNILNKNGSLTTREIKNFNGIFKYDIDDKLHLNKLYCIYNKIANSYNQVKFKLALKSKFLEISELDQYIENLISNKYDLDYSYYDINMIHNLKYYLYHQSPFKRNKIHIIFGIFIISRISFIINKYKKLVTKLIGFRFIY
ncbi:hypothetical protein BCR36DRAFT_21672 [Piromyces finnis]|uniref:Uncharacterized protein n=1 Tax=Piromyces finnis TaxID=1754191 RepID=A0A1Y1VE08_9FUNG|nr:hypothetical protein BCR36DRAFT_21672 [Piromyces finnis]|eukprot:ORX53854.1 hypothetical protein BCR36DRAFT_21672 [Piromyces finnis]